MPSIRAELEGWIRALPVLDQNEMARCRIRELLQQASREDIEALKPQLALLLKDREPEVWEAALLALGKLHQP